MITISLCMILKDEEKTIQRCLDNMKDVVDEIVIVDTGSKDNTKELIKEYTDKIYNFKWVDDFSKARNYSFSKATKDYILWLDADEIIDNDNKYKLLELKKNLNENIDIISMKSYINLDENNNPQIIATRNRLVKRIKNYKWIGFVHEYIDICCEDNIYDSDICIIHDKLKCVDDRNLKIYIKNIELGNNLNERDLFYYGKEIYCNEKFDKSINILENLIKKDICEEYMLESLCKIAECYLYKKEGLKAREYLYKTFEYGIPSGDILYNIALSFQQEEKYCQAIYWYEIILNLKLNQDNNQYNNICCLRFKPHLNLCFCYSMVGNIYKAYYHHKKCLELNPLNKCVKSNDEYFKCIFKE